MIRKKLFAASSPVFRFTFFCHVANKVFYPTSGAASFHRIVSGLYHHIIMIYILDLDERWLWHPIKSNQPT